MKIAVDMDEVIADLLEQYIFFLNTERQMKLLRNQFTGYYTWDGWNGTSEQKIQLFKDFYQSDYFLRILPMEASVSVLGTIKQHNQLYIVTSRPEYLKSITHDWIEQYFPGIFTDVYFADYLQKKKKSDICRELGAEYIIEDSLDYARDCAAQEINALLLSYPWNIAVLPETRITRVESWQEIPILLTN